MDKTLKRGLLATAGLVAALGVATPANAVFVATICSTIQCSAAGDVIVTDNSPDDLSAMVGAISFSRTLFGYTFLVNTSQSKPVVGSATAPQLDLSFTATTGAPAGPVFLNVSDTDFTAAGSYTFTLGGTNSGGDGSVTGRAWGGTNNTQLMFSGANLFSSFGPFTTPSYSGMNTGAFTPTVNPYSLTIGMAISRTTAGTSTGDLNVQIAVPEPSTWALMLIGPALIGFVAQRRRRR